jgi:hypothetical protein
LSWKRIFSSTQKVIQFPLFYDALLLHVVSASTNITLCVEWHIVYVHIVFRNSRGTNGRCSGSGWTTESYVYIANENVSSNRGPVIVAINESLKLVDNMVVTEKSALGER